MSRVTLCVYCGVYHKRYIQYIHFIMTFHLLTQSSDFYNTFQSSGITLTINEQTAVVQFEEPREARCVFIQSASYKQTVLLPLVRIYFIGCGEW